MRSNVSAPVVMLRHQLSFTTLPGWPSSALIALLSAHTNHSVSIFHSANRPV
jgi:hypothetical protein